MDATTRTKIIEHYQKGQGSIQDIARVYHLSVDEVLEAVGEGHLSRVSIGGDMIDPAEAGPNATLNYGSETNVPFSLN